MTNLTSETIRQRNINFYYIILQIKLIFLKSTILFSFLIDIFDEDERKLKTLKGIQNFIHKRSILFKFLSLLFVNLWRKN